MHYALYTTHYTHYTYLLLELLTVFPDPHNLRTHALRHRFVCERVLQLRPHRVAERGGGGSGSGGSGGGVCWERRGMVCRMCVVWIVYMVSV